MNDQKTILLIDDEVDLVDLVSIAIKSYGYHVEIAHNGLEGLKKLETIVPDLIVLDINMPKMGGVEFYQNICDENDKPKYPIFILTARANLENLFKGLNVHGFMSKPFEIYDLMEKIKNIIGQSSVGQ